MNPSIICFGQQPNGFFPKRFLVAKINTARRLQQEIGPDASVPTQGSGQVGAGGKIVFFYHDSDADYRETITIMRDRSTGEEARLNFTQENKLQKKHSPLYLKRIPADWKTEILKQLPRFVDKRLIDLFASIDKKSAADFCLEMYNKMGLLDGIDIIRSSDQKFRENALDLTNNFFADIPYEGEIVRARIQQDHLALIHEGGGVYTKIPINDKIEKRQITPAANERFAWMQSVIKCTHYIYGEGEKEYLDFDNFPKIKFIQRDEIDNPNYAFILNS